MLLIFSFCSCRAEERQGGIQPQGLGSAEEAIQYDTPLSGPNLRDEIAEDLDLAKETYEGGYYLINLIVDSVSHQDYIRSTFNIRGYNSNKGVYFAAYVPEEEREGIVPGNVVQIVGKLYTIEKQFNGAVFVEFTDAHCLGTSLSVSGEIKMIDHNSLGQKHCNLVDYSILPDHGQIVVYLPEDSDYAVGDIISATGKLQTLSYTKDMPTHSVLPSTVTGGYTDLLYMKDPESIEIVDD